MDGDPPRIAPAEREPRPGVMDEVTTSRPMQCDIDSGKMVEDIASEGIAENGHGMLDTRRVLNMIQRCHDAVSSQLADLSLLRNLQTEMVLLHSEINAAHQDIKRLESHSHTVGHSKAQGVEKVAHHKFHSHGTGDFEDMRSPHRGEDGTSSRALHEDPVEAAHRSMGEGKPRDNGHLVNVPPSTAVFRTQLVKRGGEGESSIETGEKVDVGSVELVVENDPDANDTKKEPAELNVVRLPSTRCTDGDPIAYSMTLSALSEASQTFSQKSSQDTSIRSVGGSTVMRVITLKCRELTRPSNWIIHPDSLWRSLWDFSSCFALMFDSVMIPYILAWSPEVEGFIQVGIWGTAIFWTLDVLVTLNSSFYSKDGDLEVNRYRIFRRYLRSTMVLDAFICTSDWFGIAMEMQGDGQGDSNSNESYSLLRLVKINRIVRIARVLRVSRLWERLERLNHRFLSNAWQVLAQVFAIFVFIVWLNHILACLWYAIGQGAGGDTGQSWLDADINSENSDSIAKSSMLYQYTTAYHWSISQLTPGSMQVVPMNSAERVLNICYLLAGLFFCTSLISRISALMIELHMSNQEQSKIVKKLRIFLRQKRVTPAVAQRVEKHIRNVLTATRPITMDDIPALDALSKTLRNELKRDIYLRHLVRLRIFLCLDNVVNGRRVLKAVCEAVETRLLATSEELFGKGLNTRSSYILVSGCLYYTTQDSEEDDYHSENYENKARQGFFLKNENTWVSSVALWTEWQTRGYMEADGPVELAMLDGCKVLPAISLQHPRFASFVKHYQKSFIKLLKDTPNEEANDLDEVVDHALVVFFLPLTNKQEISEPLIEQIRQKNWLSWGSGQVLKELETELNKGKCALVHTHDGSIVRVAIVIVLRVFRPHEEILVQIGEINDAVFKPMCRLPGTKLHIDGVPSVTAMRLKSRVQEDLGLAGRDISTPRLRNVDVEKSTSPTYGLVTQYNRNIFDSIHDTEATKKALPPPRIEWDESQANTPTDPQWRSRRQSWKGDALNTETVAHFVKCRTPWFEKHIPDHIHVVDRSNGKGLVYAWVYPNEIELLQKFLLSEAKKV